jgi:hypothetical protein
MGLLIFVFAGVSSGRCNAILAEFGPVPNAIPVEAAQVQSAPDSNDAKGLNVRLTPAKADPKIELGGPAGPEPTRFGDWEKNGRCVDF